MTEGESEENHMLSRQKEAVTLQNLWLEWLFESTYCLQMVEVRQEAPTCKSNMQFRSSGQLPVISLNFYLIKDKKKNKTTWVTGPLGIVIDL